MKRYRQLVAIVTIVYVLFVGVLNLYLANQSFVDSSKEYRVSISRIQRSIEAFEEDNKRTPNGLQELENYSKETYPYIISLYCFNASNLEFTQLKEYFETEEESYTIILTKNAYYKVTYQSNADSKIRIIILVNAICCGLFLILLFLLFYLRKKVIQPFHNLSELPYELSKGNLAMPLKEQKSRFFGRFLWGMDLLRENIEDNKKKELELQKEKKLLLLSLSHDIKTPLSAIKLYSKALTKNLYQEEEKKISIAENIGIKADEIEEYISKIVKASNEDFLTFDVNNSEFYVATVLQKIDEYYHEKMALNQIEFSIAKYNNCILKGDAERFLEVLQNVIENAIKYGDGKKIWMECEQGSEEYVIHIYNTGCHLPEKEVLHIFDSFYRGSNVKKQPGSGLGLYICRKLMHLMGGEILASIEEDEGDRNREDRVMVVHVVGILG